MSYEIEVFARSNEGRYISLVSTSGRGISSRLELRSALEILSDRFQDPEFTIEVNEVETTVKRIPVSEILKDCTVDEELNYFLNEEVE